MYKAMQKEGTFSEEKTAKYVVQLARALKYCHDRKVMPPLPVASARAASS